MNKGSARSGILGISPSRRGEMSQNVIVPERQGSFDKVKNNKPDVNSASFVKINNSIDGGVAVKSTLFNPDRKSHIDYRGTLEAVDNPEKKDIQQVLSIGTNLGAFRTEKAED
ncbi:hypothetical protein EUA75_01765 [TM7 phylum sp. oral taxon 353]|nr:hypothetical protein EUA75_01765 [TM7 phylum sp. oral taxon 353]